MARFALARCIVSGLLVSPWCALAAGLAGLLLIAPLATAQRAGPPPRSEAIEQFRKMSPAERLKLIEKLPQPERYFHRVARGDVIASIVERGTIEPAGTTDIVCQLPARGPGNTTASTIKWVIDDGAMVKKGDRILELDSSALEDAIRTHKITAELAAVAQASAVANAEIVKKQNPRDVRLAEITLRLAEFEFKKYSGNDNDMKAVLALKVEQAGLVLEQVRSQTRVKELQAEAEARAKTAQAEQVTARLRELETQLAHCKLTAPQDGLVVYHAPAASRFGGRAAIIAPGEPVVEGQKLLQVWDLKSVLVSTRVHEALISRVRTGQKANMRIDAFPNRTIVGQVKSVGTVAQQTDWLTRDVKVYPVTLSLTGEPGGLKPGMTADVRIVLDQRPGVIQVPVQAVLHSGRERFCYVKTAEGIEERKVLTGLSSDLDIEIREGLKEGDVVLRDVRSLSGRPDPGRKPEGADRQGAIPGKSLLVVRSVKLPLDDNAPARRTFVDAYGLTYQDLERIRQIAEIAAAVPLRSLPQEVRSRERTTDGQILATTPAFQRMTGLKLAAGRFLTDDDEHLLRNVAVLGPGIARSLFPDQEVVGQTVRLGGHLYTVVGVLAEQAPPGPGLKEDEANRAVCIPLATYRGRFGETVFLRRSGSRQGESVQLNTLLIEVNSPNAAPGVLARIRTWLEAAHPRRDWSIETIERQ